VIEDKCTKERERLILGALMLMRGDKIQVRKIIGKDGDYSAMSESIV
jgi:hypothetical protein